MYEIRAHGRGGQGVKTSARIISRAAFTAGNHIQDFAIYGAERRGAPVASFCRIDKEPILLRGYVDSPDYVLVLDESLFGATDIVHGLKQKGRIIVNSTKYPLEVKKRYKINAIVHTVDATGISLGITKKDVPNVSLLGAFVKISRLFSFGDLENAIRIELKKLPKNLLNLNIKAARKCYDVV